MLGLRFAPSQPTVLPCSEWILMIFHGMIMQKLQPIATFRTGAAGARFIICLSGSMDALEPTEPYSRIYLRDERVHPNPWSFSEHHFAIPSVCLWRNPATGHRSFATLSEHGEVVLRLTSVVHEQIPDAGLNHPLAKGYGYLNDIQQIGTHLYACGFSGQVYRRNGDNDWVHMDQGILQKPGMNGGEYFAQAINGPHERAIYLVGCEYRDGYPPRADFWNGHQWSRLDLPVTASRLTNIYVESEERIIMCGDNGTLLAGNARDGFTTMGPLDATQLFTSVTKFQDLYYLGSNMGLFQFNPKSVARAFRKVRTRLQPELQDANIVEAVDDVLWSMGTKDIARFDGVKWERFHHPDNPPIGGADSASDAVPTS